MSPEDIRGSALKKPVNVVDYLCRRLHQVGVRSVHGVPGDYNLAALDYLDSAGLQWMGNVNELNAGYSADGYARVKGISALITTFGVGELSAVNAIAGAYAEYVPIIHIVGMPSTTSQQDGLLLHHTLGEGDYSVFVNMSRSVSCDTAVLRSTENAAELIDHAIHACFMQSRPVYIGLPTDLVARKVEGARLDSLIDLAYPDNDPAQEDYAVSAIMTHLRAAKRPSVLVDACAIRHRALDETYELVLKSGLPTFSTPMGKGAIDETLPNYVGVYAGSGSHEDVKKVIEASDLVLSIGAIKSDFNTTGFTYRLSSLNTVDFHSFMVRVKYSEFNGCRMNGVLKKVTDALVSAPLSTEHPKQLPPVNVKPSTPKGSKAISHEWLWPNFSDWIQPDDVVITETGTSGYGIWEVRFKKGVQGLTQILWGSIGFAFGALQGAAQAAKEIGKNRTILFTGDGSFQLTAQELSTIIRLKLSPIIFVVCNEGYTIERYIHGMQESYNDVGNWKYKDLVAVFGARPDTYATYQIKTREELLQLLKDADFANSNKLRFVELYMPKEDAPVALKRLRKQAPRIVQSSRKDRHQADSRIVMCVTAVAEPWPANRASIIAAQSTQAQCCAQTCQFHPRALPDRPFRLDAAA